MNRKSLLLQGVLLVAILHFASAALAQSTTAFYYQGELRDNGTPATGNFDLRFTLYNDGVAGSVVGAPQVVTPVTVEAGVFTVALDFGAGAFDGTGRWLEIAVRDAGSSDAYDVLSPRQQITPVPMALYAASAGTLTGELLPQQIPALDASVIATGTFSAAMVPNLDAAKITTGTVVESLIDSTIARDAEVWLRGGNSGTTPGMDFLGTTDNQPLEFRVNGTVGLVLRPGGGTDYNNDQSLTPNLLLGGPGHTMPEMIEGAVIGGGSANVNQGSFGTVSGGTANTVSDIYSTVGGGSDNTASSIWSTVGGGSMNTASGFYSLVSGGNMNTASAQQSTVGGGNGNSAEGSYSTVGGGYQNSASMDGSVVAGGGGNKASAGGSAVGGGSGNTSSGGGSTVAGGQSNTASGPFSTVSGGLNNTASGERSTVPGGSENTAMGNYSLAAGFRAKANHSGAFVWGDLSNEDFASTGDNQFLIRADGGVGIGTNDPQAALDVNGIVRANGFESMGAPLTLGTADNQPLEFSVNGMTSLTILPGGMDSPDDGTDLSPNLVVGGPGQSMSPMVEGSVIGGGSGNVNTGSYATIGGGYRNTALEIFSTVAGGAAGTASGVGSTVIGGDQNSALGVYSTAAGGSENSAMGENSFAAGHRAKASHAGAYVWGDSTDEDFASTGNDQFLIRASGGVGIGKNDPQTALDVNGIVRATGFEGMGAPLTLGTTDNQPLEFGVNGVTALIIQPGDMDFNQDEILSPNLVVGGPGHTISEMVEGSVIGGGGHNTASGSFATVGGGYQNAAMNFYGTVGGGTQNTVSVSYGTVGGGFGNSSEGSSSTVAGGAYNTASGFESAVGGGDENTASGGNSTVGGGKLNNAMSTWGTVGGGFLNTASGTAGAVGGGINNTAAGDYSAVPGGIDNAASGNYSLAAGRKAKAMHPGAFVWSDSTDEDFASTGNDQFLIRASGGVGIGVNDPSHVLQINGVGRSTQSTWATTSDRRSKENIVPVEGSLARLERLRPVTFEYTAAYRAGHEGHEGEFTGFVAQEVEEVFPDMVTQVKEKIGEETIEDFRVLNTGNLTPHLVRALQELKAEKDAEIESLRKEKDSQISELKAQNQAMAERLAAIEAMLRINAPEGAE